MLSKRGQGLSLNVIIIAALALIVLVVLVVIFTGRIGVFQSGVSKESNAELKLFQSLQYGDCHPNSVAEQVFLAAYEQASSADDKELTKSDFREIVAECKGASLSQDECGAVSGCVWK